MSTGIAMHGDMREVYLMLVIITIPCGYVADADCVVNAAVKDYCNFVAEAGAGPPHVHFLLQQCVLARHDRCTITAAKKCGGWSQLRHKWGRYTLPQTSHLQ